MAICLAHTQHCTIIRCSLARTCCASKFHARVRSRLRVFSFLLWGDRRARRHECSQAGWAWFFDKLGPCLPLRNTERLPPCPCGNPTLRPDYLLNWHHCCRTRSAACACACMRVPSCTLRVVVDASFGWPAPKVTHVPGQFAERFEKLLRMSDHQRAKYMEGKDEDEHHHVKKLSSKIHVRTSFVLTSKICITLRRTATGHTLCGC